MKDRTEGLKEQIAQCGQMELDILAEWSRLSPEQSYLVKQWVLYTCPETKEIMAKLGLTPETLNEVGNFMKAKSSLEKGGKAA